MGFALDQSTIRELATTIAVDGAVKTVIDAAEADAALWP
jgi:hypothetical protein